MTSRKTATTETDSRATTTDLEDQLRQLVSAACKHPAKSHARQKALTQIIRLVSTRLWKENTPYYQDALQQTWIYFCHNICESGTGQQYDPDRGSIIAWLNFYLRKRLQDFRCRPFEISLSQDSESGKGFDPPDTRGDIPPILDEVRAWAEADATGELRKVQIKNRPEVNCRVLILRRLPPETSWKVLSEEFEVTVSTLSSFYRRQCLPHLRKFGQSEGYL
ncbi:MAG: sigma-70 family RNA polymerase sigma factor [Leptolyngbyaceae cyanobacterium RU_5_1]|nr:sigma-70 family RNA polymerase sigma factor [Leptolyngbyaceae cyanobacterium RU_5_1]